MYLGKLILESPSTVKVGKEVKSVQEKKIRKRNITEKSRVACFCPGSHSILEPFSCSTQVQVSKYYFRTGSKPSSSSKCRDGRARGNSPIAHCMLVAKLRSEFLTPSTVLLSFLPTKEAPITHSALCFRYLQYHQLPLTVWKVKTLKKLAHVENGNIHSHK